MKSHKILKYLKITLLLLVSTNVLAVLSFTSVVPTSTSVNPLGPFSITYVIDNPGPTNAVDGINIQIAYDTFAFNDLGFVSSDPSWQFCTPGSVTVNGIIGSGLDCSFQGTLAAASSTSITVNFEVGSTTLPSPPDYQFDSQIYDIMTAITPINTTAITVLGGGTGPEYAMTANGSLGTFTYNGTAGESAPLLYSFELTNSGSTGISEIFELNAFNGVVLSNPTISQTGASSFACSPKITPADGYDCFNQGSPMVSNEVVTITGTFTGYNSIAGSNQVNVFNAVSLSGDSIFSDDTAFYDYVVAAAPATVPLFVTHVASVGGVSIEGGNLAIGSQFNYKALIKNASTLPAQLRQPPGVASNVVLTIPIPANVSLIAGAGAISPIGPNMPICNFSALTSEVVCTIASLPSSSTTLFGVDGVLLTLQVDGPVGMVSSLATITADNASVSSNLSSTSTFNIIAAAINVDLDVALSSQTTAGVPQINFINGDAFNLSIDANNLGTNPAPVGEVLVESTLPASLSLNSIPTATGWDCSLSSIVGNTVSCTNTTTMLTNNVVNIIVPVVAVNTGAISSSVNIGLIPGASVIDGITGTKNATHNVNIAALEVDLQMQLFSKNSSGFDQTNFAIGENFTYELVVSNLGPDSVAATEANITDVLPVTPIRGLVSGITLTAMPTAPVGWDCSGTDLLNNIVNCFNSMAFDPNMSATIIVPVTSGGFGQYDNTADINLVTNAGVSETILNNNSSTLSVNINPLVDFTVTKIATFSGGLSSNTNFFVGDSFDYKMTARNVGLDIAPIGSLLLSDQLPAGIILDPGFTSPVGWSCTVAGSLVECTNINPIGSGVTLDLRLPVSSNTPATITNNVTVAIAPNAIGTVDETVVNNNSSNFQVNINPTTGNLSFTKTVTGGVAGGAGTNTSFAVGDTVIYNLKVENLSTSLDFFSIDISDTLDASLQLNSFNIAPPLSDFSCNILSTNTIDCFLNFKAGMFSPGQTFEVEINATALSAGTNINNIASLVSEFESLDSNPVLIDIGLQPTTLSATKQALVAGTPSTTVTKGTAFTYRVNVSNTTANFASNVQILDTMPAGVNVISANGVGWTCDIAVSPVSCTLAGDLTGNASTFVDFSVEDISATGVTTLTNNADVQADNAPVISVSNTVTLTNVAFTTSITQTPDPVVENGNFDIVVDISNTGTEPLNNIQIVNTLPTGFSYPVAVRGSSCNIAGLVMTCTLLNPVANGTTSSVVIPITAIANVSATATYTNNTTVSSTAFPATANVNTIINVVAGNTTLDYAISLIDNIDPVQVGSPYFYTVRVNNTGDQLIEFIDFILDIPADLSITTSTNGTGISCNRTGKQYTCSNSQTGFSLIPGASQALLIVNVQSNSFIGDVTAVVNSTIDISLPQSASQTTTITALPIIRADMSINKTASVSDVPINGEFTYELLIKNNSSESATQVNVTDDLPTNLELISINAPDWSCTATSPISCDLASLAPSSTSSITILVKAITAQSVVTNTAFVSASEPDPDATNNSSSVDVNVFVLSTDLEVIKSASVSSITSGDVFDWVIKLNNNGDFIANNVVVIDQVPSGFDITNVVTNDGTVCTNVSNEVNCSFSNIEPSVSKLVTITGSANISSGQLDNSATATSDTTDFDLTNNTGSATVQVNAVIIPEADLSIQTIGVDIINQGDNPEFEFKIANNGPSGALKPVVNIQFSGVIDDLVINQGGDWTCSPSSLTVECIFNDANMVQGHSSSIFVKANTTFNVLEASNITIESNIQTTTVDPNNTNNTASQVVQTIINRADISVAVTGSEFINQGETSQFVLDMKNDGPHSALSPNLVMNLTGAINGVTVNANSSWECSSTLQIVDCQFIGEVMPVGHTSQITLSVDTPINPEVLSNLKLDATISSNTDDQMETNNTGSFTTQLIENLADLSSSITGEASITQGDNVTYELKLINAGPNPAIKPTTTITVDGLIQNLSVEQGSAWECEIIEQNINCSFKDDFMLADHESTIVVSAQTSEEVTESQQIIIGSTITSITKEANFSNNTSTFESNTDVVTADLSVAVFTSGDIDQGDVGEFQIQLKNNGSHAANMPNVQMSITSGKIDDYSVDGGESWSCTQAGLNINCTFNDSIMPVSHQSVITVTLNTTLVVVESENLILNADISSTTQDLNLANNFVTTQILVEGSPVEEEIRDALIDVVGDLGDDLLNRTIQNISGFCESNFFDALEGTCSDLYDAALAGDRDTVSTFLREITPNLVIGQSTSTAEIALSQFKNVGTRLAVLKNGGGSGFSSAGLNARYGNGGIPLGMLAYLNQTDEATDGINTKDNDFISPWGFFVNGTISMGSRDATTRELAFDFDTFGLTAGFDYRLSASKVVGVALGYANFDSNVGTKATLKSTGITLTGYGSFYITDNFYVDTRISYGKPQFDQSRDIDFTLGGTRFQRTAIGDTTAQQLSFAVSAGYQFYKNAWNITPNGSIHYIKTSIDGFTETGAGDFNFIYSDQELKSLVWSAGLRVSKAISLKNGVITPQFDFDYNYESKNDGSTIEARFIRAPLDELFILDKDAPDRTYGSAGIGFVYITSNGKQAYINYRSVLGLEGFSRGTFNLGARFEF